MKIGILGGTFDPIHNAHVYMAKQALKSLSLNRVYLMPAFCPPHKNADKITGEHHRIHMIELAIEGLSGIGCSDFEIRNRLSYTADTLTALKETYPEDEFYFIVGGDSISIFESWYHPEVILEKASIAVIRRLDESNQKLDETISHIRSKFHDIITRNHHSITILQTEISPISSSDIRRSPLEMSRDKISPKVYQYILENHLYSDHDKNMAWSVGKIKDDLKEVLNAHRYEHTIAVAETAKNMAETYGINPNTAYLAGLIHDCAKHYTNDELVKICMENHIPVSDYEKKAPYLLHSKVGAYIAEKKYQIEDSDILNAVIWHTTGKPDMTTLEQIVFCADYIEPGRDKQPNLSYLREISHRDLNLLTYHILKDTLNYLRSRKQIIDINTEKAYEFYKKKVGEE